MHVYIENVEIFSSVTDPSLTDSLTDKTNVVTDKTQFFAFTG